MYIIDTTSLCTRCSMVFWTLDIAGPIDQWQSIADKNNDVAVKYD